MIKNCSMSRDKSAALQQALDLLLEKAFGSGDVEYCGLLRQVLEGPGVKKEDRALLKFYFALQGCWIAVESSDSMEKLNSNTTVDALFRRLLLELRKELHSRAVKRHFGDRISSEFILNFVLEKAWRRLRTRTLFGGGYCRSLRSRERLMPLSLACTVECHADRKYCSRG